MPGALFHVGAGAICPHGAPVTTISANTRVLVSGQPVATFGDNYLITGCPFAPGGVPQPCLRVQWLVPAARVLVNGQPVILQTSTGLCMGAAPAGPPNVLAVQPRVVGT